MTEPSSAYQLFHRHFQVRVPNMFCYSIAQLEEFGRPTTGNRQIDDELDKAPRDMLLTPVAMMTYYEEGSPIWFDSRDDVSTIYGLIIDHLNQWNYILNVNLDIDYPPIEDFIRLDSFAECLYPLTCYTKENPLQLGLRAKLTAFGFKQNYSLSRIRRTLNQREEAAMQQPAKGRHESCILALVNRIDSLQGYRE